MLKNVLLTGGSRGLGLAIAEKLQQRGFRVIAASRKISVELEQLIKLNSENGEVHFTKLDMACDNMHDFVGAVTKEFGHLYGLINNAAVGVDGILATMHETEIMRILDVNLKAPILLTKYASRSMFMTGEGRIVNVSSILASTGFNGLSVYGASKAGLIGFTKSLARELGRANITVNALAPGYMSTEMTQSLQGDKLETIKRRSPLKRLATPDEVAEGAVFFLEPHARSITGTVLTIDGGSTA